MRKIPCLVIISLFCLSSILPVVNSIYVEKSTDTLVCVLDNGLMDSAWPMQSHDNRHTGRSPYSTEDNLGTEKWRFIADGTITGGTAIAEDGTLYFGSSYFLFALNSDGTFKWKYPTGNAVRSIPAIAEDGTIYIGSWDSKLHAIYPDGTLKWKFTVDNDIDGAPAIALDGTIYVTTCGSGLYAVNPNGTLKWHYNHGYSLSDPAIGDDGTIYYGDYFHAIIYAINPDGTEKWNFTARINIRGSASIADDGTIYMEAGGELYALNPDNGSVIWKTPVGLTNHCPAIDKNGMIYIGEGSGQMDQFYAFYPNNGTIKWSFDPGNDSAFWKSSAAISDDGTIYVGTYYDYNFGFGGEIIALNSDDGSVRWRKLITSLGWVGSSPCIGADGTVYVCSIQTRDIDEEKVDSYGYVHAFGPVTSNEPPNTPIITGKPKASIRYNYYCYISTVDPDLNPLSFYIDWGDNNTELTEQYASTEKAFLGHRYADTGTYTIRVKAIDEFDAESDWATLTVSMLKSKVNNKFLNTAIFERTSYATIDDDDDEPPYTNLYYDTATGEVTLIAVDYPIGGQWSGVKATYYKIDSGDFEVYTAPFMLPEGTHTVYFYSEDIMGNKETTKSKTLSLDTTPPTVHITLPEEGGRVYLFGNPIMDRPLSDTTLCIGKVPIEATADDNGGTGVNKVLFSYNGETGWDDTAPYTDVFTGRVFGNLTISVTAIDNLGHESDPVEITVKCYCLG